MHQLNDGHIYDAIGSLHKKNLWWKNIKFNKFPRERERNIFKWNSAERVKGDEKYRTKEKKETKRERVCIIQGMREGIQAYRWAGPLLFHNQRLKLVKTIFFDAFDISNRREISGRHGVALAWNYLYPPIPLVVVVAVVVESSLLLQYFFLWSEQQNKRRVCRLCAICTEKERGGGTGPCGKKLLHSADTSVPNSK